MESSRKIHAVPGAGGQGSSEDTPDPTPFLSALREAAEHESDKEERLDGKSRGIVTVTGAYFAIVQTVAFSSAAVAGKLEGDGRTWTIALAITAIGALCFAVAGAVKQQWPRKHQSLPSDKIGQDLFDLLHGAKDNREAVEELARRYAGVTQSRINANKERLRQYYVTSVFCILALIATTAELVVSLLTRTPT
jgi:hypothetical protein